MLRRPWAPGAVLTAVFYALVLPLIALQRGGPTGAYDQETYHLPTIARFARELPGVDLNAVKTATGPGYHYVMAVVYRLVTEDRVGLELASSLLSLLFLLAVLHVVSRFVERWVALALVAPLVLSPYVLQSAAWLNTDNFAALFVVASLAASLEVATGAFREARAGLAAAAAAVVRQIHLWTIAPLVVAGALGDRGSGRAHLLRALAWSIPAVAVVAWLAATWSGLTPPAFQDANASRFSPSVFAFTLAMAGLAGAFYLPAAGIWPIPLDRRTAAAAALGGVAALAVPTNADFAHGRGGGGLWIAVEHSPEIARRSLLIAVLSAAGAVALTHLVAAAARRSRAQAAVLVVALLGFAAAQSATNYVYQRYVEPIVLIVVALLAALALGRSALIGVARRRFVVAMAALLALQAASAVGTVYRKVASGPDLKAVAQAQSPRLLSTYGTVRSRILTSTHSDQLATYR